MPSWAGLITQKVSTKQPIQRGPAFYTSHEIVRQILTTDQSFGAQKQNGEVRAGLGGGRRETKKHRPMKAGEEAARQILSHTSGRRQLFDAAVLSQALKGGDLQFTVSSVIQPKWSTNWSSTFLYLTGVYSSY